MSVHIRLSRHGGKKSPFYRIVVADRRSRRDGRFIEKIGTFNPLDASGTIVLDQERLSYWVSKGAQLSETVDQLVKRNAAQAREG